MVFAYFDPDASGVTEEEKEIKKFSAEDFTFSMLYTNGSGDDVVITDDDIESFRPAYPVFTNKSKREGELEVTINFKNTSVYHNAPYSNGSVKVMVNVVDISMDDLVGDIEEHPVANTNVKDAHTDIVIQALKTERGIDDSKRSQMQST